MPTQSSLNSNLLIMTHPSDGILFLMRQSNGSFKRVKSHKPASDVGVQGFREIDPGVLFVESSDDEGSFIAKYDKNANLKFHKIVNSKK